MPATRKASAMKSPVTVRHNSESLVESKAGVPVKGIEKPATKKKVVASPVVAIASDEPAVLVPATPEAKKSGGNKRKRLSKAFSRPLDKKLKKAVLVRERFTIPGVEYAQFALLKKRLSDQGLVAKKSELVRAGLVLLSSLGDEDLKELMAKVPPAG